MSAAKAGLRQLDARGLRCPLPVLKTRKALKAMAGGEEIEVLADDPAAIIDMRHFCAAAGHRLLHWEEMSGVLRFRLAKGN
jgi:tRNA 2-thiouridine synthesizing protein A